MSSTKNVKLGVCIVFYDGEDLGYTQGGVQVSVKTDTHKVNVDQFGKTTINEYIMSRDVSAKVPLAETTLENLVAIMPGATLVETGGTVASGTVSFAAVASPGDTVTVNGVAFTFKSAPAGDTEVATGTTASASAANLAAKLSASVNTKLADLNFTANNGVLTVTSIYEGTVYNAVTLAASVATVSGATLSGGVDPASRKVEVTTGVGVDLLSTARELRLHPKNLPITDTSEDFVIPLAATAGALDFAYELEKERVFSVEFNGYPDADGKLFRVGQ